MDSQELSLKEHLVRELPIRFTHDMLNGLSEIYQTAYDDVFQDQRLGENESKYELGHHRRALCEARFRNIGAKHNMSPSEVSPKNGGCSHVQLSTKSFNFALCHVQTRMGFPNFSHNRKQFSEINQYLDQLTLKFDSTISLTEPNELYAIIIHTEKSGNKSEFGSAYIGFPNKSFTDWTQEPIDLVDIMLIQKDRYQKQQDPLQEVEIVMPTWKKVTDIEKETS